MTAQRTRNTQRPRRPLSNARKEIGRFIFSYSFFVHLTSGYCYDGLQVGEIVAAVLAVVNFNVIPAGDFSAPMFIPAQSHGRTYRRCDGSNASFPSSRKCGRNMRALSAHPGESLKPISK